jgi:hypothetical protein
MLLPWHPQIGNHGSPHAWHDPFWCRRCRYPERVGVQQFGLRNGDLVHTGTRICWAGSVHINRVRDAMSFNWIGLPPGPRTYIVTVGPSR